MHEEFLQKPNLENLLGHLVEECGEVLQAIGKIHRFGFLSHNPLAEEPETNKQMLFRELQDLKRSIARYEDYIYSPMPQLRD